MRTSLYLAALVLWGAISSAWAAEPAAPELWKVGAPIVSYWASPPMSDALAEQMVVGGFNLLWCSEKELDLVARHGVRGILSDGLLVPASLEQPEARAKLDALIDRVKGHPALYSYYLTDEPNTKDFPGLGKLVSYLRQRDPAHLAFINLFPTYATNEQLGTSGDTVTAYREHLRQYMEVVQPSLISYDHYQFRVKGDTDQYFLNLAMIRETAQQAGVPFLNIVQTSSWDPIVRVPGPNEVRYLVYTTVAYGAQGIAYFVYGIPGIQGGIVHHADGTPTELYAPLKTLNREFVTLTRELQPLRSLAVYQLGMSPPGAVPLPKDAPFFVEPAVASTSYAKDEPMRGLILGYFGAAEKPSHVVVVNLDYRSDVKTTLVGPGRLEAFDATTGTWSPVGGSRAELQLPGGGGKLLRLAP